MVKLGSYTTGPLIGPVPLGYRYAGEHSVTGQPVEICILDTSSNWDRELLSGHLRRASLIQSSHVRRPIEFDLSSADTPYLVMPIGSPLDPDSPLDDCRAFVQQVTMGLQFAHRLGVVVGPLDTHLLTRNGSQLWQVDASGLLSHVLLRQAFLSFRFAAPETVSSRLCDCLSDVGSWGALLAWLLTQPCFELVGALRERLAELARSMAGPEATERLSLEAVLDSLAVDGPSSQGVVGTLELDREFQLHSASGSSTPGLVVTGQFDQTLKATREASQQPTISPATRIGRFSIERKLGEGGMGAVYLSRDLADGQSVALKVLSRRLLGNQQAMRRFAKEARMLAQARSPYVANLLETNTEGTIVYLAVEYIAGGSLGSHLRPGEALDWNFALAVAADAARGLALAHDRGIVHRDIKPDNILLTEAGASWLEQLRQLDAPVADAPVADVPGYRSVLAKLTDFGIARGEHQSQSLAMTADNALLGTPIYMAPEQCLGANVDGRADIYALGITFYQMLAGRPPFEAASNVALMAMHAHDPPPTLRTFRKDIPESLEKVIDKCLAKNPDARYSHGRELLVDLENLQRGLPTSIGLHPPLLIRRQEHAIRFEHAWDLDSSPAELWPYVSHTDRVNHAIGLTSVQYTVEHDAVHGPQRIAQATIAGQRIRWREHPYEWIEGRRLSVLREFVHGPLEWFVNVVELQERAGGGSRLVQTLQAEPRSWLGKTIARYQLGSKAQRSFGSVYQAIDRYLQQQAALTRQQAGRDPWGKQYALSSAQIARLQQRMNRVADRGADPDAVDVLRQLLEHGSELSIARIRPYALADQWKIAREHMLEACMLAAHEGVLLLLWDILCPSCRIPSDVVDTLAALKDHSHCQACNVQFELDFGKSIELIFRAHPEIRPADTKTYCIGGPAWSRHVVAQLRLAAGERFACDLSLEPGAYTVRGPQLPFSVPFRVAVGQLPSRWEVSLAHAPDSRQPTVLQADRQAVWLWNDSTRDLQVRIERLASLHDAVTASAASSSSLFRELFGDQVLANGQLISVAHITYLLVKVCGTREQYARLGDAAAFKFIRQQLDAIHRTVRDHGGAVIKHIGEMAVATLPTPLAAMRCAVGLCARQTDGVPNVAAVVNSGPAIVATLDERLDYFGRLTHDALEFIELAQPGVIITPVAIASMSEVRQWSTDNRLTIADVKRTDRMLVCMTPADAALTGPR